VSRFALRIHPQYAISAYKFKCQHGVLIHSLTSVTFLAPMEITAATLGENVVEHFYTKEPNLPAIRQFLSTDCKRHLSTLSRSEKVVAGRQAKRFRLSADGTL
jgi:hypothetical protein